jgi:hypothetical protein
MSASHVHDGIWKWREFVESGASMIGHEAGESEAAGAAIEPSITATSYNNDALLDGFDMENIDFFNSMDWAMEDWAIDPATSFGFDGPNGQG